MTNTLPRMMRDHLAYLNGVIHGDGWLTNVFGLKVKDKDFADTVAASIRAISGRDVWPKTDERGYWNVRTGNRAGTFDCIRKLNPRSKRDVCFWLRGM